MVPLPMLPMLPIGSTSSGFPVVAAFHPTALLVAIPWAALGLLCFWVWRRAKSGGHLLMLVGAGWLALDAFLRTFDVALLGSSSGYWGAAIGAALVAGGFWATVRPLVAGDVARILQRTPPGSAPPPTAPPTPPPSAPSV